MKKIFKNEILEMIRIIKTSEYYCVIELSHSFPSDLEENDYSPWMEERFCYDNKDLLWRYCTCKVWNLGFNPEEKTIAISEEEIIDRLSKVPKDSVVRLLPRNTNCGGLNFQFGWVHKEKTTKEDIREAVMPQSD